MTTAHILLANDDFIKDRDMLDLYQGMQEFCYDISFYTATEAISRQVKYQHGDVFCGTINLCRVMWNQFGIKEPTVVQDYPTVLEPYLKRRIRKTDLKSFRKLLVENDNNGNIFNYFIKPLKCKLFTGKTFNSPVDLDRDLSDINKNTELYVCAPIDFLTEYRVYVHKKSIIGVKHYYGKWDIFPNPRTIETMVELVNPEMPVGYSLDVGVDKDGDTILVECNDSYALGNYGLEAKEYAAMLRDRWWEITNYVKP